MKLSEKTLAEIVEAGYSWADFESREESLQGIDAAKAEGDTKREMDDTLKLTYLAEKEERSIVDIESMDECDFHSFELTSFARLAYAHGSCSWNDRAIGAIDYDRSYDGIRVLIEDMGDICAVYIKDYGFGYIKPFGECLYVVEDLEGDGFDEDAPLYLRVAMRIERDVLSGTIDLEKELSDYYHEIPETAIKILGDSLNDLVTVQEAADALGVSTARVKKMLADGVLDGFKCAGRLKISKAAVDARIEYIAEHGKPTRGKSRK